MGKNVTNRTGAAHLRALEAWNFRVLGLSWEQVAEKVGYSSASNAARAVTRFCGKVPQPDLEQIRRLWDARLDLIWKQAVQEMARGKPNAVKNAVAVADRASKMNGLDAATQITLHNPDRDELGTLVRNLVEMSGHQFAIEADPWAAEIVDAETIDVDNEEVAS